LGTGGKSIAFPRFAGAGTVGIADVSTPFGGIGAGGGGPVSGARRVDPAAGGMRGGCGAGGGSVRRRGVAATAGGREFGITVIVVGRYHPFGVMNGVS
jgi:hypothetical protein